MPTKAVKSAGNDQAGAAPVVAVVVSRYNGSITERLLDGALEAFRGRHPGGSDPVVVNAPGAFELPALALAAARTGRYRGVLALGCIIKGETSHDVYLAHAVASGLVQVTVATGVPVSFGVLTVDTPEQARQRAGGLRGNKGFDSMNALLDTIGSMAALARREPFGDGTGRVRAIVAPDKARAVVGGGKA